METELCDGLGVEGVLDDAFTVEGSEEVGGPGCAAGEEVEQGGLELGRKVEVGGPEMLADTRIIELLEG